MKSVRGFFLCLSFCIAANHLDDSTPASREDSTIAPPPAAQLNGNANNSTSANSNDNSSSLNNQNAPASPKTGKAALAKRGVEELYDIPVGE